MAFLTKANFFGMLGSLFNLFTRGGTAGGIVVRQLSGTPGTDELQVYHDGLTAFLENKDSSGAIVLLSAVHSAAAKGVNWRVRGDTNAGVAFMTDGNVATGTQEFILTRTATGSWETRQATNGQGFGVKILSELTTIAAAATTDTTIQLPAGAIILGVSVRVTVVIPTATNFTVGDSGSAARFSTAAVSVAANSTDPGTKAGAYYNASATSVRITPDGTPAANTGRVRVTIHYIDVTPPTS